MAWGEGADGAEYAAVTVGPGAGISANQSDTSIYSIGSLWQGIVNLFSPSRPDLSSNNNGEKPNPHPPVNESPTANPHPPVNESPTANPHPPVNESPTANPHPPSRLGSQNTDGESNSSGGSGGNSGGLNSGRGNETSPNPHTA